MAHLLSGQQLAKIESAIASKDRALAKMKSHVESRKTQIIHAAEAVGASAVLAFVRGKFEQADGSWNIPGTPVDIEGAVGAGLVAGSFFKAFGEYDADAGSAGVGILSHYAGQLARKWSKTGKFSLVAGSHHVGADQALANALDGTI